MFVSLDRILGGFEKLQRKLEKFIADKEIELGEVSDRLVMLNLELDRATRVKEKIKSFIA